MTGDFNSLASTPTWPTGFAHTFTLDEMVQSQGNPPGSSALIYPMTATGTAILPPDDTTCNSKPADGISDHCAFRVDYNFASTEATPPPMVPFVAAPFWANSTQLAAPFGDWTVGEWKAECGMTSAVTGLSFWSDGSEEASRALCRADAPITKFPHSACVVRSIPLGQRGTAATGDWDTGFSKGECAANEYVAGISQTTDAAIDGVLCCQGAVLHARCARRLIGTSDREATDSWNWDPGNYKAECGPGRYVAGVCSGSHYTPHAILCCQ